MADPASAEELLNVPGNQPAIVSLMVSAIPDVHELGIKFDMPPAFRPPEPDAPDIPDAFVTPPVPISPEMAPAICTVIGRVIAMCIKSARNEENNERNDDRDTFPVSIICSHAERQPESIPSNKDEKASSAPFAASVASARYWRNARCAPSAQSWEDWSSFSSRHWLM